MMFLAETPERKLDRLPGARTWLPALPSPADPPTWRPGGREILHLFPGWFKRVSKMSGPIGKVLCVTGLVYIDKTLHEPASGGRATAAGRWDRFPGNIAGCPTTKTSPSRSTTRSR